MRRKGKKKDRSWRAAIADGDNQLCSQSVQSVGRLVDGGGCAGGGWHSLFSPTWSPLLVSSLFLSFASQSKLGGPVVQSSCFLFLSLSSLSYPSITRSTTFLLIPVLSPPCHHPKPSPVAFFVSFPHFVFFLPCHLCLPSPHRPRCLLSHSYPSIP